MKNDLTYARLREIETDALLGKPVPAEDVQHMADALQALLDEAAAADFEEHDHVGELVGCIEALEKLRAEAEKEKDEAETKHETKLEENAAEHEKALEEEREKRLDMEKDLDEWKRRAEKAEHDLSTGTRSGHVLDLDAARKVKEATLRAEKAEREVTENRSNLELALTRRAEAEKEARETAETNLRLQGQMDRAAAWWQEKAVGDVERELSVVRRALADETREKIRAEKNAAEVRFLLKAIADGKPEDAHRAARIALGRDIIEKTGTGAREEYVPTRSERKKARAGK